MKTRLIISLAAASLLACSCAVQEGMAGRLAGSATRTFEYSVMNQVNMTISSTVRKTGDRLRAKAASRHDTWDCTCGSRRLDGDFCSHCGRKRPDGEHRG